MLYINSVLYPESKNLFHCFVSEMDAILRMNEKSDDRTQKQLLQDLFKLEEQFRKTLLSVPAGRKMYQSFMRFIVKERGNLLVTRAFFRERQSVFSRRIAPAFYKNDHKLLFKFRINFLFIKWIMMRYKGRKRKQLSKIFQQIQKLRQLICENNLPLAINRVKIFWSKVPISHLEYMDLIQTASEGLLNAIDKFVPPYKRVFRSVAISRMTLNMITDNTATLLKFSPKERRILYRANNAKYKERLDNDDEIIAYINKSFNGVTIPMLQRLVNAASYMGTLDDSVLNITSQKDYVEDGIIKKDLIDKLKHALNKLTPLESKVIRLSYGII